MVGVYLLLLPLVVLEGFGQSQTYFSDLYGENCTSREYVEYLGGKSVGISFPVHVAAIPGLRVSQRSRHFR